MWSGWGVKALLGGAKRVMLSLAEEASPLGTAAGAIVAVSMKVGFTVGRWECFWRRRSRSAAVMEKERCFEPPQMPSTGSRRMRWREELFYWVLRNCKC